MTFGNFSPDDTDIGNGNTLNVQLADVSISARKPLQESDGNIGDDEADNSSIMNDRVSKKQHLLTGEGRDPLVSLPKLISNTTSRKANKEDDRVLFKDENESNDGDIDDEDSGVSHREKPKRPNRRAEVSLGKVGGQHKGHQLMREIRKQQQFPENHASLANPNHNPFGILSID